jgi:trafficking protein particle complex subunit 8
MYFLRRAHELYKSPPEKSLSPSFWEAAGKSPGDFVGFDAVASGIEQPLGALISFSFAYKNAKMYVSGRLLYTTGDVSGAVSLFLGLLRGIERPLALPDVSPSPNVNFKKADNPLLEDFRIAFKHLLKIDEGYSKETDLKLPFKFCDARASRIRIPRASLDDDPDEWERLADEWQAFWKTRGKERLETDQKAAVNGDELS